VVHASLHRVERNQVSVRDESTAVSLHSKDDTIPLKGIEGIQELQRNLVKLHYSRSRAPMFERKESEFPCT